MNTTKNTTPRPTLSSQTTLREALAAAAVQVELPTIRWDARPERKARRQIDQQVVGIGILAALIALLGLSR